MIAIIFGQLIIVIPMVLNGAIGSKLHVPFPVAIRSSFGFYFSRFAVVVRMVTALFWHGKRDCFLLSMCPPVKIHTIIQDYVFKIYH